MKLAALDLNLLLAFKVLAEEKHVTRAAQRLGLSQPAMSNALARLRRTFDDELLVRTSMGWELTPKAMALAGPVRAGLAELERALDERIEFDPRDARRTFRLAMADYSNIVVLPAFKRRLLEEAPNIDLVVLRAVREQGVALVDRGEVDVAVGRHRDIPPHLCSRRLFGDRLVCIARDGHPAFRGKLTIKKYVSLRHVQVQRKEGLHDIDRALERLGFRRRVELTLPEFAAVPFLLAETDLIASDNERLALKYSTLIPFAIQPLPFDVPPLEIFMTWHSRVDRDPAHCWLRAQIAKIV